MKTWVALAVVRCVAALLPEPDRRARYREQWQADVLGAADLGLSPLHLALGAAIAAARISRKGTNAMLPIGPLALALRAVGGPRARQRAAALAVLSALVLLGGVTMLIAG